MISFLIWMVLVAVFIGWPVFMALGAVFDALQLWKGRGRG